MNRCGNVPDTLCATGAKFAGVPGMNGKGNEGGLALSTARRLRRGLLPIALLCLSFATVPAGGAAAQDVSFSAGDYRVSEGEYLRPELVLSHTRSQDVTVLVMALDLGEAMSGEDFASEPWRVTIPAGQRRQTFSIETFEDNEARSEQFLLHISPYGHSAGVRRSTNGNPDAIATIVGKTRVSLREIKTTVWEGGTATIRMNIANPKPAAFTIDYVLSSDTASAADVVGGLGTRSITVKAYSKHVNIPIQTVQDNVQNEGTETVSVALSTSDSGIVFRQSVAEVQISDDDMTPEITFTSSSSSVNEDAGTHHVTLKLTPASTKEIDIHIENYGGSNPASRGSDYEFAPASQGRGRSVKLPARASGYDDANFAYHHHRR